MESNSEKMEEARIFEIFNAHEGKVSDKWAGYIENYASMLKRHIDRPIRILEIGVQNGGSLEIWGKIFPAAVLIVGCDLDAACGELNFSDSRVSIVVGDVTHPDTRVRILEHSTTFDLIIDDGSHRADDIIRTFCLYFGALAEGGVYIIEDLHCSYWSQYGGGLFAPDSSIAFFKTLIDFINLDAWRRDGESIRLTDFFTSTYGFHMDQTVLATVESIEFRNSICVISKTGLKGNSLGPRHIVGEDADVSAAPLQLNGTENDAPPQEFLIQKSELFEILRNLAQMAERGSPELRARMISELGSFSNAFGCVNKHSDKS